MPETGTIAAAWEREAPGAHARPEDREQRGEEREAIEDGRRDDERTADAE